MQSLPPSTATLPAPLQETSKRRARLQTSLACLGMALAAVLPLLGFDGWPENHEGLSIFERAEGFRRAYAAGDFFPLWTPFCHLGHGSPWPFFYHRLFNTLSGGLGWMVGSAYRGVQLALMLVLFVGASGMAAAARRLGASARVQVLAAFLLCFSHYAFFDWLIRNATAEFSAMMLYPWLLWGCLRLHSEGRGGGWVGLVLAALFYAHTVMFLYAFLTLAVALGLMVARQGWRPTLIATGQAALVVLVLCAPYALLMVRLEKHFNTGALNIFSPEREFVSLARYFWDGEFRWGRQWKGITPELGPALLTGLAVLGGVALASRDGLRSRVTGLTFLSLTAAVYAVLQVPLSVPFYRVVPFAKLLQFPWRLVGFLTVVLVLVLCVLVEDAVRRGGWRRTLALGVAGLAVLAGARLGWRATHPRYESTPRTDIESHLAALDRPWSANEYLPRSVLTTGLAPRAPFLSQEHCDRLKVEPVRAFHEPIHFTRLTLTVSSTGGCTVHFNQFTTPFLAVEASGPARFVSSWAGTLDIQLPAGEHRVELRRRGFLELLAREFLPRKGT
ncbi:hypothetical protein JRI60_48910 [Archangium violaceum]|uniref:hypothetical protein n=1 Tax=Archangium violaceum TaxID=83451 RepID=UPI0019503C39|nr:hypothetical protein [Archangium violaceum]QRN96819.1 hypothetical protein JRI60_48910 [Archangium violaceum]